MKIMKKTLLYTLCSLALTANGVTAWGRSDGYHIPNGDFSSWKTECGETYQTSHGAKSGNAFGMAVRPGTEPEEWNGSNINQTVWAFVFSQNKKEPGLVTSDANDNHVVLTNKFVGVGNIGSNAPAYITFGTPWVYAVSTIANCDGGTYGGTPFKGKPDAIKGTYKRTAPKTENAYVIAYLWSGTFTSDVKCSVSGNQSTMPLSDVDKAVLGKTESTGDGQLIASCETSFETTENNDWETIEVPLDYKVDAVPEKMNVIISSADYWTRGNIQAENVLEVKDVSFVYYHSISSCKYNGQDVTFNEKNETVVNDVYEASKLAYEKKGVGAAVEESYDETTGKLTITVKGNDYEVNKESVTTYTIQFAMPEGVKFTKDYTEDLYVTINSLTADSQSTPVIVQTRYDGKINFLLKNFMLGSGEEVMPVGNIEVLGLERDGDDFSFDGNILITAGDLEGIDFWYGPFLEDVPLNLIGKFVDDNHLKVAIDIDMSESLEQVINVHLGYIPTIANMTVGANKYGTFYAPFAVTLPGDVKAYTCESLNNGSTLVLTSVDGGEIPSNTAVIVESTNGTSQDFYNFEEGLKVEDGNTGLLHGVATGGKAPRGSYVLQTQEGKGQKFYQVTTDNLQVSANRCYLQLPASSDVKAISFPSDPTAIDGVKELLSGKAEIYDLEGRRLPALQKGINIVGGKKVMVK